MPPVHLQEHRIFPCGLFVTCEVFTFLSDKVSRPSRVIVFFFGRLPSLPSSLAVSTSTSQVRSSRRPSCGLPRPLSRAAQVAVLPGAVATSGVEASAGTVTTGTRTGRVQSAALAVALAAQTRRCLPQPDTAAQTSGAVPRLAVPAVAVAVAAPSKSGACLQDQSAMWCSGTCAYIVSRVRTNPADATQIIHYAPRSVN